MITYPPSQKIAQKRKPQLTVARTSLERESFRKIKIGGYVSVGAAKVSKAHFGLRLSGSRTLHAPASLWENEKGFGLDRIWRHICGQGRGC